MSTDAVESARSFLFVPGDRPERFGKAEASGADAVVCDLEDAVRPDHREEARRAVRRWLEAGHRACVRVSAVGTPDHDADLETLSGVPHLVAILVPKAEDPAALTGLASRLAVPVVAILETARGVLAAPEIARAHGVTRLALGHLDLALDLDCRRTQQVMAPYRAMLVLASRAAGLAAPVDGVTPEIREPAVLGADLDHARDLGFGGKLLIHPSQVEPTHHSLRPSTEQVAWARRVLEAAAAGPHGSLRVDGEMVDRPVVDLARRILDRSTP